MDEVFGALLQAMKRYDVLWKGVYANTLYPRLFGLCWATTIASLGGQLPKFISWEWNQGKAVAWLKTGLQFLKLKHSLIPICSIFSASCLYFQNQICKLKTSVSFHMSLASPTESAASASSQIGGLSLDSCWLDRSSMPHSLLSLDFSSSELVQAG
jgi:hypothetical protein